MSSRFIFGFEETGKKDLWSQLLKKRMGFCGTALFLGRLSLSLTNQREGRGKFTWKFDESHIKMAVLLLLQENKSGGDV